MATSSWRCSPCERFAGELCRSLVEKYLLEKMQCRARQRPILARRLPELEAVAGLRLHRQRHVVERAEVAVDAGDLEGAREALARALRARAASVMSSAPKRTWPLSGRSSPESCLMKVVLPAPFGPITACVSPSRTSKSTPSVAISAPKDLRS
jgi:hypothetical protein